MREHNDEGVYGLEGSHALVYAQQCVQENDSKIKLLLCLIVN